MKDLRMILSLILGIASVWYFSTNNVADAIYYLVLAVWVEPNKSEKENKA